MKKTPSFSAARVSLLLTGSLLTVLPAAHAADDDNTILGMSLPQVNNSAIGYGKSVDGAVSDKLFYTLGGGSVISQPATRGNMQKLGLNTGWSSDLMCGNFDLKTTVGNQLNGVTSGFKNLMGDVIQGATGAVASLPAMVIQRANPGLYDMLTNGVLQANVSFDKAQLNCQNMAKKMMDFSDSSNWTQQAMMDEYKSVVNSGDTDAVRADEAGRKVTGTSGNNWIGGQKRGGAGQPAIRVTHDLVAAGYNMMNGLPVTANSTVGESSCNGGACSKFGSAEEAAAMTVKVLGDRSMRTCANASECTSGDADDQPGTTACWPLWAACSAFCYWQWSAGRACTPLLCWRCCGSPYLHGHPQQADNKKPAQAGFVVLAVVFVIQTVAFVVFALELPFEGVSVAGASAKTAARHPAKAQIRHQF